MEGLRFVVGLSVGMDVNEQSAKHKSMVHIYIRRDQNVYVTFLFRVQNFIDVVGIQRRLVIARDKGTQPSSVWTSSIRFTQSLYVRLAFIVQPALTRIPDDEFWNSANAQNPRPHHPSFPPVRH